MPQVRVEYSDSLHEAFDRRGFAVELHEVIAKTADARVGGCKSKFVRLDETVVGDGSSGRQALVHVEVALFRGRSAEARAELGNLLVELLRRHVTASAGLTAEVREIDPAHYHKGEV